jgi:butyryl-CoA dehydrogenase
MEFKLKQEHELVRKMVREFAEKNMKPIAAEIDEKSEFPAETIQKLGPLGIMGMDIPQQYGGGGTDAISYAIAIEELSRVCAATGVIVSVNNSLVCFPLNKYGTEEQKQKYLKPLASGQKLGAYGLTEPGAGTDAAGQSTTAKLDGDEWIINGQKTFITNGAEADTIVTFAMVDKEKKHKGIGAFIVEKDSPGYSIGQSEHKLGIRGSSTSELNYDECRIPKENLLGEIGEGFKIAMSTLDCGRIGIAAQAVGIAQGALEESIEYSKTREQFGKPIAKFQAIQWMIADMATETEAARLLLYNAAYAKDTKDRYSMESAMAKLFCAETAMRATTKAVQIHGGYGYTKEYAVERMFRDAKITEIYEGTSEAQRMVIAANLLK